LTFRYYNCIPQTPNLNRGTWKKWETTIREESKTDSLLVICGGAWKNTNTLNGVRIPSHCWKVVYSLNKNTTLHVLLFSNNKDNNICEVITLQKLEEFLGYKVVLSYKED
jgi:endonuclease G